MSKETPNPSNKHNQESSVAHEEVGHSFRHGEKPHQEFSRSLPEAVETGVINTEAPETTGQLPEDLRIVGGQETSSNSKVKKLIAGVAGFATLAGGAYFMFGRSSDTEPTPTPSRTVASSSPNPGPTPTNSEVIRPTTTAAPSPTETAGGAAEQQARKYELASVPDSTLSLKFLKEYDMSVIKPEALNVYKQLIPNYNDVMFEHLNSLTWATPEVIADARNRINTAMSATYTQLGEDGKPERVDAGEFFKERAFTIGWNMEGYKRFSEAETKEKTAQTFASYAFGEATESDQGVFESVIELKKLGDYARNNPNEANFKPSDVTPGEIADLAFLNPAKFSKSQQYIEVAEQDGQHLIVNGIRANVARVYDTPELVTRVSADGKTKSDLKAMTVISELTQPGYEDTREIAVTTLVAVPVDVIRTEDADMNWVVKDAKGEGYFHFMVVYETTYPQ